MMSHPQEFVGHKHAFVICALVGMHLHVCTRVRLLHKFRHVSISSNHRTPRHVSSESVGRLMDSTNMHTQMPGGTRARHIGACHRLHAVVVVHAKLSRLRRASPKYDLLLPGAARNSCFEYKAGINDLALDSQSSWLSKRPRLRCAVMLDTFCQLSPSTLRLCMLATSMLIGVLKSGRHMSMLLPAGLRPLVSRSMHWFMQRNSVTEDSWIIV